ncbi:MAG TPA: hypothetical protein VMD59_05450 [Acidimicrobiales bacterium]|nr:hypothetical protein [Acidimicrobiales bacterium]
MTATVEARRPEAVASPPTQPVEVKRRLGRKPAPGVVALAVYALLALALYWPVEPLSTTRLLACGCADPALDAWFISWTPHALLAHVSPLFTTDIHYPYGINLATNTFMPLLGILAAPVTLTLGPVAALNLLFRLAFVASAGSMYAVLGHFVRSRRAAFVGGLFYGFSPYMLGQGSFHLNLVFVPIPPLIFACLYELLVVRRRRPYRMGLLLGGLCTAQYLISVEVLADGALLAAVAVAVLAARRPHEARKAAGHVLRGAAAALLPIVVICGYLLLYQEAGRQHIGYEQAFGNLENINADLLSFIVPTPRELLGPARLAALGGSYVNANAAENDGYLGITLLAAILAILVVRFRDPLVRCASLLAAVAYALSLGRFLTVDNHLTKIPMPFDLLWHLPLASSELPARYALFVDLFLAVVLAVGLDALLDAERTPPAAGPVATAATSGARRRRSVAFWLVSAAVLAPLVPHGSYHQPPTQVPSAFLASSTARAIPAGSVVLAYPYNAPPWDYALLWQAESKFRYKLIGGYGVTPNPVDVDYPVILQPATMYNLFEAAFDGTLPPRFDESTFSELRGYCLIWHVSTIVVAPLGADSKLVVRYLDAALGRGVSVGGVNAWPDVETRASVLEARWWLSQQHHGAGREAGASPSAGAIAPANGAPALPSQQLGTTSQGVTTCRRRSPRGGARCASSSRGARSTR